MYINIYVLNKISVFCHIDSYLIFKLLLDSLIILIRNIYDYYIINCIIYDIFAGIEKNILYILILLKIIKRI